MNNRLLLLIALVGSLLINSCKKDPAIYVKSTSADILSFNLLEQLATVDIENYEKSVVIAFTPEVVSAEEINFEYTLSEGAIAELNGALLVSGLSAYDFDAPFTIVVVAEDEITELSWKVIPTNSILNPDWGLGGFQKQSLSNNREYDWYLDQSLTGTYSGINCGPTSTTMAAKWSDETFSLSPEDARAAYRPSGGWWYTSDIDNYLTDNQIDHHFVSLGNDSYSTAQVLKNNIDGGNIAILCLDMFYIRSAGELDHHIDKFYSTSGPDWGHFIVVKGYKVVDNHYLFEIYDPYCYDKKYTDGSLKGQDRYYRSSDLFDATSIWWNHSIILSPSDAKTSPSDAIDPATIPHARGR